MFQNVARALRQWFWGSSREISFVSGTERWVYIRYPCDIATSCRRAGEPQQELLTGRVRNVSRGGINLEINHAFEVGDLLSVDLAGPDSGGSVRVLAYVVHASPGASGIWALGCIFAVELGDDDLRQFSAERVRADAADQRIWVRFHCEVDARYQFAREPGEKPGHARVVNISPTGLALLVDEPIDVGVLLNVASAGDANHPPFRILATVVRSSQCQDWWAIGCTFIRELEEEELQSVLGNQGGR